MVKVQIEKHEAWRKTIQDGWKKLRELVSEFFGNGYEVQNVQEGDTWRTYLMRKKQISATNFWGKSKTKTSIYKVCDLDFEPTYRYNTDPFVVKKLQWLLCNLVDKELIVKFAEFVEEKMDVEVIISTPIKKGEG